MRKRLTKTMAAYCSEEIFFFKNMWVAADRNTKKAAIESAEKGKLLPVQGIDRDKVGEFADQLMHRCGWILNYQSSP